MERAHEKRWSSLPQPLGPIKVTGSVSIGDLPLGGGEGKKNEKKITEKDFLDNFYLFEQ